MTEEEKNKVKELSHKLVKVLFTEEKASPFEAVQALELVKNGILHIISNEGGEDE